MEGGAGAMQAPPAQPQGNGDKGPSPGKSTSRTITDTIVGEHEHTIVGYSLIKGLGDGEPIASERFTVGGHEWVLLFYPDGKRSSSELHNINPQQVPAPHAHLHGGQREGGPAAAGGGAGGGGGGAIRQLGQAQDHGNMPPPPPQAGGRGAALVAAGGNANANNNNPAAAAAAAAAPPAQPAPAHPPAHGHILNMANAAGGGGGGGHPNNDYCALFVALIGETDSPQGVVNTSEGRVVRAFHRFTLVDQSGRGQDVAKGRRRDQGAVKISCARQDPNARNCHGYRKFVKKSLLEDPARGLLVNDTIIIKYQIELVVSTGGALSRHSNPVKQQPQISVPPPSLGADLASLLDTGAGADVTFEVDDEKMPAHKIILQARSPVFKALLTGPMREGHEGVVAVHDVLGPVFRALLHFAYSDTLPVELQGSRLEVPMAQHLLAAADRFQLIRLRCICEQRLCETVEVDTVATTLALAEQNNARELKRVCLEFVSKHLQAVMASEGYQYMTTTCPQLQSELLAVIATTPPAGHHHRSSRAQHIGQPHARGDNGDASSTDGQLRRVRARTRE